MKTPDTLLGQMEFVLDQLVSNAEVLQEISSQELPEEQVSNLQDQQDELLRQLTDIDQALKQAAINVKKDYPNAWERILELLDRFQRLNNGFIEALGVRKGLVQLEINEIRKSRHALTKVQEGYGNKEKPPSSNRKKRINALS